jgi:DNA-binding MarR family transcriptional regulator
MPERNFTITTADALRRSVAMLQRRLRALRAEHGVSASKLVILGRLNRAAGPLAATELARLERLAPQSLTRIMADLETSGFITRTPSEADRRQTLVAITPEGRKLLAADAHRQDVWIAGALAANFSETERGVLALAAPLLDRLAATPAEIVVPVSAVIEESREAVLF